MRPVTRRAFTLAATSLIAAPRLAWPETSNVPNVLDHVLLGCNDLEAGIAEVYQRTGVKAAAGGVHPGAGTKNALLSLGPKRYLEVIAPDPLQPASSDPRLLARLKHPALVGWAAHRHDLNEFAVLLRGAGIECVGPNPGSRARPDGTTLKWKTLALKDDHDGVLPFFIEWDSHSLHPSVDAPEGCRLTDFRIDTPDPSGLKVLADKLQLDVQIRQSDKPRLAATIVGPKGTMTLLSAAKNS
jgi:hypothetical protein